MLWQKEIEILKMIGFFSWFSVLKWNQSQGCESKGIANISNFEKSKKASKRNLIFTYIGYNCMKRGYKPGIDKTYGFQRQIWTFMQKMEIKP